MPDLQSGSCRFESRPGLIRTKVYSAFHPSGVGKWVAYQLRQRQVCLFPLADEMHVQVKLCYPLTMRAISERLRDASCGGVIEITYLYLLPTLCGRYPWQCEIVRRQRVTVVRWLWVQHATSSVCRPSVKLMHSWFAPTVCEYWPAAKISILGSTIIFRLNITVREVRKGKGS